MSRILIICRRFCSGEAWMNRILAYAKGFSEQGIKVCMIFLITDEKRTPYFINIPGVEVINLWEDDGFIAKLHRGLSYIKNKRRIKDHVQDGDICFMTDASGFFLSEVKSAKKNVKIIFESTEHPVVLCRGKNKEKTIAKLIENLKRIDHIYVISRTLEKYFIENGIKESKISIINMFVDTTRFAAITKSNCKEKYVAYCGVVSLDKDGVDILIEAFSKFVQRYNDYKLFIFGRGMNSEVIPQLKQLAKDCGVEDSVIFTGPIPYEDVPQKLKDARMLVLARPNNLQNQNGFPTKLGEYLSTENPVVVTKVGEIPLYIKDNVTGFLADPGNADSFALKMCEVVENYEHAIEVGKKGSLLAYNEFSYCVQVKKALDAIL